MPQKKVIITNGCFDILHAGHVDMLKQARAFGDMLIVGLNSDRAVRILKGDGRPLQPFEDRKMVLEELQCVDSVVKVDDVNVAEFIRNYAPFAWVKGGDYTMESLDPMEVEAAKEVGARIYLIKERFKIHTSKIYDLNS